MNKKIFAIAITTLLIDQISKGVLEIYFKLGEKVAIIKDFFYITYYHNTGAAWSLLTDKRYLIIIISLIATIIIYRFMYVFKENTRNNIAFGLLTGGIVGNLLDRVLFGYVRDFFDFYLFKYDYPVFNVADIAIVIGVLLLIVAVIKGEDLVNANKSSRK